MAHSFFINPSEFQWSFARSSGPGGQNVNKTNTCAVLDWNLLNTQSLSDHQKQLVLEKLQNQLTNAGNIQIRSQIHRSQDSNQDDCIKKLYTLLQKAMERPKKRISTKPTRSSVKRRLSNKTKHSEKKSQRGKKWDD
jgi:ribosome-associated protein